MDNNEQKTRFKDKNPPYFRPEDCPNNMASWLQKQQVKRDNIIYEKMHMMHMDIIDILNVRSIDKMWLRLLGGGFIILLALVLIALTL